MSPSRFSAFLAHSIYYKNKCKPHVEVKKYWEDCTSIYVNNAYPVFQAGLFSSNFEEHLDFLCSRHWQDGSKRVLDAGCGIGSVANYFAAKHPESSFVGLTVAKDQVDKAQQTAPSNVEFVLGSFDAIPFPDNEFDFIYFYQSIGYRPLVDVLKEVRRVLKPGGKLLISDICSIDDPDLQQAQCVKKVQDIWKYMFYPSWYHLKAAELFGFKLVEHNPNISLIMDLSPWESLMTAGLAEFHKEAAHSSPFKIAEFLYKK